MTSRPHHAGGPSKVLIFEADVLAHHQPSAQLFVAGLKHSSALHSLAWGAPAQQSVLETWPRLPSLLLENVFGGYVNQAAHGSADAHARVVQWVCSLLDVEQDSKTFRKRKNMGVKLTPGNRHVPAEAGTHGLATGKHHLTEQQITALLASYLSSAQHLGKGSSSKVVDQSGMHVDVLDPTGHLLLDACRLMLDYGQWRGMHVEQVLLRRCALVFSYGF